MRSAAAAGGFLPFLEAAAPPKAAARSYSTRRRSAWSRNVTDSAASRMPTPALLCLSWWRAAKAKV